MKKAGFALLFGIILSISFCSKHPHSDSFDTTETTVSPLEKLKINSGDVENWFPFASLENPDSFSVHLTADWSKITGYHQPPENLREFAAEHMAGPGNNELTAYFAECGAAASAAMAYGNTIAQKKERLRLPDFDESVAIVTPVGTGGVDAFACFGNYFIILKLRGFDLPAMAAKKARLFLLRIRKGAGVTEE
jgi:hypothetical protein